MVMGSTTAINWTYQICKENKGPFTLRVVTRPRGTARQSAATHGTVVIERMHFNGVVHIPRVDASCRSVNDAEIELGSISASSSISASFWHASPRDQWASRSSGANIHGQMKHVKAKDKEVYMFTSMSLATVGLHMWYEFVQYPG